MADPKREELKVQQKRAILVAVVDRAKNIDKEHALDEFRGLATTAGMEVVATLVQVRDRPHPASCLGSGKIDELNQLIKLHDAELVAFDNNLTPAQGKHLEDATETIIVDRNEIILDIFATTARSAEAKLQVELAQLLYFRPRLKRMWTHLERIEGGVGTGRGPGEKQLETDRRLLDKRVAELKRKLRSVEKRRTRTVAQRRDWTTVSLVGYTNAGKSTLMNALTDAGVYVADKLFATLDTRTRSWQLSDLGDVLLSDTVGFIRDLPHHLVASFKSTLEEARHADLLLHVVDVSDPLADQQMKTVDSVLDEIGIEHTNSLLVFNKSDACEDRSLVDVLRARHENSVVVSAKTGYGLDALTRAVSEKLTGHYVEARIETGVGNGRLHAYLAEHASVTNTEYTDSRVTYECRLPRTIVSRLNGDDTSVWVRNTFEKNGNDEFQPVAVHAEQDRNVR